MVALLHLRSLFVEPSHKLANFQLRLGKPVCGPYPINSPAEPFKDFLAQAIAVPHCNARVVSLAVAFNAREVTVGIFRMANADVDPVALNAHLGTAS